MGRLLCELLPDELLPDPRRHSVRAELPARLGRFVEAVAAVDESLRGGDITARERAHCERRRALWATLIR